MDVRSWRTHMGRALLLAAILLSLLAMMVQTNFSAFLAAPGLAFLQVLGVLNLLAISLLGVVAFAPSISEEKEEGTLPLLLMAGITPLAAVLSKGGGKLATGVALVAVQVPFTFLAITLGGVSATHIAASYAVLFSYMSAVAGVAVLASTLFLKSSIAGTVSLLAILGFNVVVASFPSTAWLSPFGRMSEILSTGFQGPILSLQTAVFAGIGLFAAAAAVFLFDFFARTSNAGAPFRLLGVRGGKRSGISSLFAPGRAWRDALAWKAFYFDSGGRVAFWMAMAAIIAFTALFAYLQDDYPSKPPLLRLSKSALAIGLAALFLVGLHISGAIFRREINDGGLALLLILPKSLRSIVSSKILGSALVAAPTALAFVAFGLLSILEEGTPNNIEPAQWVFSWVLPLAMIMYYYYLTVYFSLRVRTGAFLVATVIFMATQMLQGLVSAIVMMMMLLGSGRGGALSSSSSIWLQYVAMGMMVAVYFVLVLILHRMVRRKLWRLAASP